ncbi:hypothetical protein F9Z43_14985 [Pseudomonas monteilii]|uniref:Uncharacterized protein n=1 Tax=Pseudomonas monteilii TaxID=76759 RepID=A0A7X3F3S1_9PSED|nr:hypothetical protein [Pseudomonas monteilii]MVF50597.1 hypothetical protein [Pseudomonas monteilii]
MSKYEELQQKFHALQEADASYWERLVENQKKIRKGFSDFLGVDPTKPVLEKSKCPALYFGGKPSFTGQSPDETTRDGNELRFTLNLVLEPEESSYPPNSLKLRCHTKFVSNLYLFFIEESDGSFTTVEDDDFSPIYERLHNEFIEALSKYQRQ